MRTAMLQRLETSDQGTLGELTTPQGLQLWTLELPWRDLDGNGIDDSNISCIRPGRYQVAWSFSRTFQKHLYRLADSEVAPRAGILIHSGNWAGDRAKGLKADAQGCLLVGLLRTILDGQLAVLQSRPALSKLHEHLGEAPFELTILPIVSGSMP